MTEQELKEIFKLLEEQGWKPMLCDTPVPFYDSEVPCGPPNGVSDVVSEIAMMPRGSTLRNSSNRGSCGTPEE